MPFPWPSGKHSAMPDPSPGGIGWNAPGSSIRCFLFTCLHKSSPADMHRRFKPQYLSWAAESEMMLAALSSRTTSRSRRISSCTFSGLNRQCVSAGDDLWSCYDGMAGRDAGAAKTAWREEGAGAAMTAWQEESAGAAMTAWQEETLELLRQRGKKKAPELL
jgi:hypothetical protein